MSKQETKQQHEQALRECDRLEEICWTYLRAVKQMRACLNHEELVVKYRRQPC